MSRGFDNEPHSLVFGKPGAVGIVVLEHASGVAETRQPELQASR